MSKRHSISFFSHEITREQSDSHLILSSTTHSYKSSAGKRKNVFIKMFEWTMKQNVSEPPPSCIDYGLHGIEYQRESLISNVGYKELNQPLPEKPPSLYSESDILNSYHNLKTSIQKLSDLMQLCKDHVTYYQDLIDDQEEEEDEFCLLDVYMKDILSELIHSSENVE